MEWYSWVLLISTIILGIINIYLTRQLLEHQRKLEDLRQQIHISELQIEELQFNIRRLRERHWELETDRQNLETEIQTRKESIEEVFQNQIAHLEDKAKWEEEQLNLAHKDLVDELQKEYMEILTDLAKTTSIKTQETQEILQQLQSQLDELKSKHDAAVEEYKRAQAMAEQQEFYKLHLDDTDILEIQKLREVEIYLRDAKPLNKVIWSVYYEHPYTDLVGRVIGSGRHTGIYKLTNITNGMVYVGQANDIANRWKQHIKCAIGAENAPNNKLYPAMKAVGPEKFTFEIIEECVPEALNEREQYWQEFYKAKEFGYSVR